MTACLADLLENLHRDLAPLIDSSPEPMRSRLQAIATALADAAAQEAQVQAAQTARITALAQTLHTLGAPPPAAMTAPIASAVAALVSPAAPYPAPASPPASHPAHSGAPSGYGERRILAEGVWLLSRKTVSPSCEAFVFEIGDDSGGLQELRLEAYRLNGKTFVKTRSPLAGASAGWMANQDSYGAFFLCHQDKIAGIANDRLRMAADFALG